jgi:hypothetical protein
MINEFLDFDNDRINPETGIIQYYSLSGILSTWVNKEDEDGYIYRINTESGVYQKSTDAFLNLFDTAWADVYDSDNNLYRINKSTGVFEKYANSLFSSDWYPAEDDSGNFLKINPETGVLKEYDNSSLNFFGDGWRDEVDEDNLKQRIDPDTGELQTETFFGWSKQDGTDNLFNSGKNDADDQEEEISSNSDEAY